MIAIYPSIGQSVRADRAFLGRVVRYLAAEAGIRQFLDVGHRAADRGQHHQVVQEIAPESRIVYVDNDPMVLTHARALLTSSPRAVPTTWTRTWPNPGRSCRRRASGWT